MGARERAPPKYETDSAHPNIIDCKTDSTKSSLLRYRQKLEVLEHSKPFWENWTKPILQVTVRPLAKLAFPSCVAAQNCRFSPGSSNALSFGLGLDFIGPSRPSTNISLRCLSTFSPTISLSLDRPLLINISKL